MTEGVSYVDISPPDEYLEVDLRAFRNIEQLQFDCHTRVSVRLDQLPLYPSVCVLVPTLTTLDTCQRHPQRSMPLIGLVTPTLERLVVT